MSNEAIGRTMPKRIEMIVLTVYTSYASYRRRGYSIRFGCFHDHVEYSSRLLFLHNIKRMSIQKAK